VLIAEIILLILSPTYLGGQHRALFIAAMCLAFGLQNGVLSKADGISLHSTYLTGTLTHLLSLLVQPVAAGAAATKFETRTLLFVWFAFVAGALCGGLMISRTGPKGIWGMPLLLIVYLRCRFSFRLWVVTTLNKTTTSCSRPLFRSCRTTLPEVRHPPLPQ